MVADGRCGVLRRGRHVVVYISILFAPCLYKMVELPLL